MVPLRVSNMISNVFFMTFGALAGDIRTFLVFLLLFPINAIRLRQMLNLVKKARNAVRKEHAAHRARVKIALSATRISTITMSYATTR
jgi:hypothetical protein